MSRFFLKGPALLAVVLLLAAGCAAWTPAGGLYEDRRQNYSVELPEGWRMNAEGPLFLTKDGPDLQYIFIQTHALGEPLLFSRKTFYKGMRPVDMAELFLENNSLDPRVGDFKLLEFSSGTALGYPGFKVVGQYRTQEGLRHRFVYWGLMTDKWYYGISYSAALRVYFDRDLSVFNAFFSTFKVVPD